MNVCPPSLRPCLHGLFLHALNHACMAPRPRTQFARAREFGRHACMAIFSRTCMHGVCLHGIPNHACILPGRVPYICCQVPKMVTRARAQKIVFAKLKINEFFSENTFINSMCMKPIFMVL
jgi:hypothetical protein